MSKEEITEIAEGWVDDRLTFSKWRFMLEGLREDISEYTFPDREGRIDYGVVDEVFTEVARILHKQQEKQ